MKNVKYSCMKDWVFFFVGLAITALFLIFSTPIFELMYYQTDFSNEMYNQNLYFVCAVRTCLVCWGAVILYYWIIDYFSRWYHWLLFFVVAMLLAPVVTVFYMDGVFTEMNLDFEAQCLKFSIVIEFVTIVLFFINSFCVKNLSSHCSTTPF